jgi:hypothetical protein
VDLSAPRKELLEQAIRTLTVGNLKNWEMLLQELAKIGRHDLVEVIRAKLAEYARCERRRYRESFRQKVARLDDRLLRGQLRKIYRKLR